MLSYRHAFHAGNFADVLKHLVLMLILEHLVKKDKPFCCVDTHAGPGTYQLTGEYAQKNREFDNGIGRLWQRSDLPGPVAQYVSIVKQFNDSHELTHYPGSPVFARRRLREHDRLFLYELHSTEIELLKSFMGKDKRVKIVHGDGFKECIGLFPPIQRRGLVLMDPSYEIKSDYREVIDTLIKLHRRFASGVYAVWYPVVERRRINSLERTIEGSGIKNVQLYELGIRADRAESGMTANGMIVVNPPWTLRSEMETVLPYLARTLGEHDEGFYRIRELAGE